MKPIYFIILLLIVSVVCLTPANSQEIQAAIDFQVGLPQGDFKQQLDRGGYGLGIMGDTVLPDRR